MNSSSKFERLREVIKKKGCKMTKTRERLLLFFIEQQGHFSAEEIYQKLRGQDLSLPTIYRNLELFEEAGIVSEFVYKNAKVYELKLYNEKQFHIHFTCEQCGLIYEYDDIQVFKWMLEKKEIIETVYEDKVKDISVMMTGICKKCLDTGKR